MHAAMRHGAPSLMSLPKDGKVGCEVRPSRSPIRSLNLLDRAHLHSTTKTETMTTKTISRAATHPSKSS